MDNDALTHIFRNMNERIINEVNPDSVINKLFAKEIIGVGAYHDLFRASDPTSRCRKLFSLLYLSSHPETFVHFRLALFDEYPEIVDEIDKQLSSLTTPQQQQQSTDDNILLVLHPLLRLCWITLGHT